MILKDVINNKAKYVMDADRYKKQEIDQSELQQTWTESNDSDDDQDNDMIDID